ncbi:MAG: M48 family metalloprotease [Kofleriaceae bacterium]
MTRSLVTSLALLVALPACMIADDDPECRGGKCDGDSGGTCEDARYADGTCQTSLDCVVPDIDCFRTFDSDADARAWFATFELTLAASEGRPPRALIAESDPRFVKARSLLDRGWSAFREHRPVGKLHAARPALVLVDDPSVNAFVIGESATGLSVFTVMVQTGLLEVGGSEDALLGIMMHELQHAVGLHLIGNVREEIRAFYVAADGREPFGREQTDDPRTRAAAAEWISHAAEVGPYAHAELGGFITSGGVFDRMFVQMVNAGLQNNPTQCAPAVAKINQLRTVLGEVDPIGGDLVGDLTMVPAQVDAALTALRDDCLAAFPYTLIQVMASTFGVSADVIEAMLPASDRALIDGKHAVDALAALATDRRVRMRGAEAMFEDQMREPWTAVRYFSTEEDADDVSIPVMRASDLDPAGVAEFLALAVGPTERAACDAVLAAGQVPAYGVDLSDEHHGTCWRRYHVDAFAAESARVGARGTHRQASDDPAIHKLRMPRTFADQLSHARR